MDQHQGSGGETEREETQVDFEPIRNTYDATTNVVKLGRRWLKTKPGPVGSADGAFWMFDTFRQTFMDDLWAFEKGVTRLPLPE